MSAAEDDIILKPETKLKESFSDGLSLVDLDKSLLFLIEVMKKWGDHVSTHVKIGEDSFSLSLNLDEVNAMIERYGGRRLLDYVSAVYLGKFAITADFAKKELKVRAINEATLQELRSLWESAERSRTLSAADLRVSLLSEAKRYILSCTCDDGSLTDSGKKKLSFERSHVVLALSDIDYIAIQENFARYLVQSHNEKKGWGKFPDEPSTVAATTSSVTFLSEARPKNSNLPSIMLDATRYLSGFEPPWKHSDEEIPRSAELLYHRIIMQFYQEKTKETIDRLGLLLSDIKPNEIDFLSLRLLLKSGEDQARIVTGALERFVRIFKSRHDKTEFSDAVSLSTILFAINVLGIDKNKAVYQAVLGDLLSMRNHDGGWPMNAGKESTLSSTLLTTAALVTVLK
jgi:hypothetical protein